ncbi:hypothetical protein IMSHALPRED_008321 [Imshaugia aleurites]|uniref:Uncharacterized protein n=1 Tax=Imshaugia aleurites TaxID=172621 RepID=A0A8H3IT54_9LECA|nr:hypothetical protein IMSHALPRED_008321 [Imshaugia aleurites]
MHKLRLLSFISFLPILTVCGAVSPQSSNSQDIGLPSNLTYPSFSPNSLNASNSRRFYISDTRLAIDFWHQTPPIPQADVLMCIIEGLSKIFGTNPTETIPGLSTFYYKRNAFIHVQDLNPTVGRACTFQDLANTLRGVGEYMTQFDMFWTTEFQVWDTTTAVELKIGSGGVGGGMKFQATDAVTTGLAAQTGTPACNHGSQHCVA